MEICERCGGSKYTDALKVYNKGKPAWCMPRKGTELHAEVLSIMNAPKKPTRKLRKAPAESVTNLGQVGRKRIEVKTVSESNIPNMEVIKKPTRKLRKAPTPAPAPAPAPARVLRQLTEDQLARAQAIQRSKERQAQLKKDPEYQAKMKKITQEANMEYKQVIERNNQAILKQIEAAAAKYKRS